MSRQQRTDLDKKLRQPHPASSPSVEEMRAGFRALMEKMPVPEGIRTTPTELGSRRVLRVDPTLRAARPGTILYFHGGGFVVGSPETALGLTGYLVVKTGVPALSLDYRLAPESPFPAAIEDGVAAYRALLARGTSPASVVFAGESAGGGLTVTTCLAAREARLPMPAAIVAFSPSFDASRSGESMKTKAGVDPIFTPENLSHTGAMYMASASPEHPWLSPAIHADLRGLPPMLLQAGTNELLLDDATRLATRARDAGVDVILDITADAPHVFQAYVGALDEADQALERAALFISQNLRG